MGPSMSLWLRRLARWWHCEWDVSDGFEWCRRLGTLRWISMNIPALLPECATTFEKVITKVLGLNWLECLHTAMVVGGDRGVGSIL